MPPACSYSHSATSPPLRPICAQFAPTRVRFLNGYYTLILFQACSRARSAFKFIPICSQNFPTPILILSCFATSRFLPFCSQPVPSPIKLSVCSYSYCTPYRLAACSELVCIQNSATSPFLPSFCSQPDHSAPSQLILLMATAV